MRPTVLGRALALAAAAMIMSTTVVFADNTVPDGDDATPVAANPLAFGTVCIDSITDAHALVAISRNGSATGTNTFHNSATVTVSVNSVSGSGLGASMDATTITLPSDWTSLGNNTMSDAVSSKLTLVAGGSAGSFSGSVTYRASGLNADGNTINRDAIMNVSATVSDTGACAPAPSDTTPPTVTVSFPSPTAGSDGWFNAADVTPVEGTVTAADDSNVTNISCTGATLSNVTGYNTNTASGTLTVSGDGTHNVSCEATDGASPANTGTASGSSNTATIKIDTTAPVITDYSHSPSSPDGNNGWYVSTVTETFHASDATSGLADCAASFTKVNGTTEGSAVSINSGPCSDNAGNMNDGIDSAAYKIDLTGPSATLSVTSGTLGNNGWYVSDVTVSTTGSDSISSPVICTAEQYQTADTTGTIFNGSCANDAGITTNASPLTIKIDATAPVITDYSPSPSSPDGNNGWYVSTVTETFHASDATSGLADCAASFTQSSGLNEGSAVQIASGPCSDNAGNTNSGILSGAYKIDLTNPYDVAFVGGPANGGSYYFGFVPSAPTCTASDDISGFASCAVTGYSNLAGNHTMTATAYDYAGRSASAQRSYAVLAWTLLGFYQPVDMTIYNTVKGGSTVPLKFEVFAGPTELTSTSVVKSFIQTKIACDGTVPTDDIEFTTTGGTSLRYDTSAGQFVQNWQTPKLPGQCYRVTLTTDDGGSLVAFFKLK